MEPHLTPHRSGLTGLTDKANNKQDQRSAEDVDETKNRTKIIFPGYNTKFSTKKKKDNFNNLREKDNHTTNSNVMLMLKL